MRRLGGIAIIAALLAGPTAGDAAPWRAVVIGSNQGLASDAPLQFAESDAAQLARALGELGVISQVSLVLGESLPLPGRPSRSP